MFEFRKHFFGQPSNNNLIYFSGCDSGTPCRKKRNMPPFCRKEASWNAGGVVWCVISPFSHLCVLEKTFISNKTKTTSTLQLNFK